MTREELGRLLNLKEELISQGRSNRPGTVMAPNKITVHNTSNASFGADANAHSKFVRKTGHYVINNKKNWVSWHYTVDDNFVIKQLPINEQSFHAGKRANQTSISIEVCMHKNIEQDKADEKAAMLIAVLCYDLSISIDNVVTHKFWTGKNCPTLLLKKWDVFIERVNHYLAAISAQEAESLTRSSRGVESTFAENLCWNDEDMEEEEMQLSSLGFSEKFIEETTLELPFLKNKEDDYTLIHHKHLSIYFNEKRKLPLFSACNYDKIKLIEKDENGKKLKRGPFRTDYNVEKSFQLGQEFYYSSTIDHPVHSNQNVFDRGHIISRRYTQWGDTPAEAKRNADDTFYFTNIAPQTREMNQQEWERLEAFVIEEGKLEVKKVSIFSGMLLKEDDPKAFFTDHYTSQQKVIQIPLLFWKIVYYKVGNELRRIAFMMSQKNVVTKLDFILFEESLRELDPFSKISNALKPFIVKVSLIEEHTNLTFTPAIEKFGNEEPLELILEKIDTEGTRGEIEYITNLNKFI